MLLILSFAESSNASEPIFAHEYSGPTFFDVEFSIVSDATC
jgi:hypothetical protein